VNASLGDEIGETHIVIALGGVERLSCGLRCIEWGSGKGEDDS
jgi:hypothetical protein